jgi:hypothetical protein
LIQNSQWSISTLGKLFLRYALPSFCIQTTSRTAWYK